jgi:hypothetical protein
VNLPYFWDRTPETLPKAELNPLTNPALERNLNRWAQAYFSNPPGKREQAISKLLQEIKNETSEILIAEQARLKAASSEEKSSGDTGSSEAPSSKEFSSESSGTANQSSEHVAAQPYRVVCPTCKFQNPLGHKYCGECGAPLHGAQTGTRIGSTYGGLQPRATARPLSETPRSDNEVQWLRERNLGSTYAYEPAPSHGWKYAIAGLIIVLGGFAYLQWGSQLPGWIASPAATVSPSHAAQPVLADGSSSAAPTSAISSSATGKPAQTIPASSRTDIPKNVATSVDHEGQRHTSDQNAQRAEIEPAVQKSSLLGKPQAPKPLDIANGGSADLQLAQRYLGGSMGARDSSEAAKLLWKAVRQENATAAVLLSELYARGDGVPKNCDQARLLLVAAAKRGAPQAAEQLRNLETRGCQ